MVRKPCRIELNVDVYFRTSKCKSVPHMTVHVVDISDFRKLHQDFHLRHMVSARSPRFRKNCKPECKCVRWKSEREKAVSHVRGLHTFASSDSMDGSTPQLGTDMNGGCSCLHQQSQQVVDQNLKWPDFRTNVHSWFICKLYLDFYVNDNFVIWLVV